MNKLVKNLQKIVSRRHSSRVLSFSMPHVFKALQMLDDISFVSRKSFSDELYMGEGAVKTLILHLKEMEFADSTRSGTYLTKKGKKFAKELLEIIPNECVIPKCTLTVGNNNFAILLRNFVKEIKFGIEQRDAAILYGAIGAITMLFNKNKFVFPGEETDCLYNDKSIRTLLLDNLKPIEGDVIIIATASEPFVAELAAKNSALFTIAYQSRI